MEAAAATAAIIYLCQSFMPSLFLLCLLMEHLV
jgi:hypothetical protein